MERTAEMYNKANYPTTYKASIPVKGIAEPQSVYTIQEPAKKSLTLANMRRPGRPTLAIGGIPSAFTPTTPTPTTPTPTVATSTGTGSSTLSSFDNVVLKILKSPSTKKKVQEAT